MAQPTQTRTATLPDTPAARRLQMFLDAYNRGDLDSVTEFITSYYTDPLVERGPDSDRAVWNAMDYTNALWHALRTDPSCGLAVHRVERSAPHDIRVLAQCGLAGEWVYIRVRLAPQEPERMIEFRVRPALRPPDLATPQPPTADLIGAFAAFVERLVAADVFSGAVLVAKDGQPIFERAYGLATQEFEVPNRIDTKFNIGSLNKMFTAVIIAQLAQEGHLRFGDVISQHLAEYPPQIGGKVTIHHLLAHLSGIGSYWNERFECERPRIRTVSDFLALFQDDPLNFEPGTRWQYSNGGYIILGAIIEHVTGMSYYDVVRERIYRAAGMENTDAYEMDMPVRNLAYGYTHVGPDGWLELAPRRNNLFLHVVKGGPGGGGFSTVEDLLRFDRALREHILLDRAHTEAVLEGKVAVRGPGLRYSYGFFDRRINGQRVVGHSGNFPGIGAQFDMYLDTGYTVVILSNYDPCAAQIIVDQMRDLLTRL
mgnify:CR=1 FL=1